MLLQLPTDNTPFEKPQKRSTPVEDADIDLDNYAEGSAPFKKKARVSEITSKTARVGP